MGKALAARIPADLTPNNLRQFRTLCKSAYLLLRKRLATETEDGLRKLSRVTWKECRAVLASKAKRKSEALLYEDDRHIDLLRLILAAPSVDELRAMVGLPAKRITKATDPNTLTRTITQAIADGWDRRKIGAELTRVFSVTASAARRIARTEGLRVATETQIAVSEQLSEIIIGYRISAVLDSRTRPDHRKRHGTIYYREPKAGQLGFDAMPRPPVEKDNSIAYNCRCFLVPVFR